MKTFKTLLFVIAVTSLTAISTSAGEKKESEKEVAWQKAVTKMIQTESAKISTTDQLRVDWVKQIAEKMQRECKVAKRESTFVIEVSAPATKKIASAH